jgi:maltooligosyltrehalose trehalohydrolase
VLSSGRAPLARAEDGFWELGRELEPDAEYAFSLDGGEPLPDPRAPRLPRGVGGPAQLVDHARFAWSDETWQPPPLSSGVLYEIHVGTFSPEGTFDGAIAKLDALVELGITHVELMPVHSFPGTHGWGYDGVGLFAPHEPYGGPDGLKRLVDAAHWKGLAVLLDVVYNHLGPSGNVLPRFGPYLTDRHRTPWGDALNLDGPDSGEVRRFLCDNAVQWLRDYHVDGLRLDAIHAMFDDSPMHLLVELREEVDALAAAIGRHKVLIAESDLNDPIVVTPVECGGYGMDAQWSDDFHHALHAVLTGERGGYYQDFGQLADLAKAISSAFVYEGQYSRYRRRRHGCEARGLGGNRFLAYLQTHDQIGNRAHGERSSHLMPVERLKLAAGLVLLSPFIPMLFQGEEWGARTRFLYFSSHTEPDLARSVRDGRRQEFAERGWNPSEIPDPQEPASFLRSRLDWGERERDPHADLLDWHRRLIQLRGRWPELSDDRLERVGVRFDEKQRWLALERGRLCIACNLGDQSRMVPLETTEPLELLLSSDPEVRVGSRDIALPPDSLAVLRVERERDAGPA